MAFLYTLNEGLITTKINKYFEMYVFLLIFFKKKLKLLTLCLLLV